MKEVGYCRSDFAEHVFSLALSSLSPFPVWLEVSDSPLPCAPATMLCLTTALKQKEPGEHEPKPLNSDPTHILSL